MLQVLNLHLQGFEAFIYPTFCLSVSIFVFRVVDFQETGPLHTNMDHGNMNQVQLLRYIEQQGGSKFHIKCLELDPRSFKTTQNCKGSTLAKYRSNYIRKEYFFLSFRAHNLDISFLQILFILFCMLVSSNHFEVHYWLSDLGITHLVVHS